MTVPSVLDASSTLSWLFRETDHAEQLEVLLLGHAWIVPSLWRLEIVQAVTRRERQKRYTSVEGSRLLRVAESLNLEFAAEPADRTLLSLAALSRPHQLSAYDAVYLDLAIRRGLPLLTNDQNLRDAAERVGVTLVEPPAA